LTSDAERWNARYRTYSARRPPAPFLLEVADLLPERGRAIDLAGGDGRHAVWLAERGLEVTCCDVSPVGLALAQGHAAAAGVALACVELDLEAGPAPAGPWDLVLCSYFLSRPLLATIAELLAPEGLLVFWHPTRSNLQRNPRPGERFVLEDGELPSLVPGLEPVRYDEGWRANGVHEARLVARRRGSPGAAARVEWRA